MKLTIVEKNLLSWTAMHIDFVMGNNTTYETFDNTITYHKMNSVYDNTLVGTIKGMRNLTL